MARKITKKKAVKNRVSTNTVIPMVETDFLVLVIVAVACFVLLGVAGYFLK
jgi:hypothetical protein